MNINLKLVVFVIPIIAILAASLAVYSIPPPLPGPSESGVIQRPRLARELWQAEIFTVDEARGIVDFGIKLPSRARLPNDFSIRAVLYDNQGNTTYQGLEYHIEAVHLVFWNQDIIQGTRFEDVIDSGGIWLEIMHGPGLNSTDPYGRQSANERIGYLFGYPSIVRDNYIEIYQFQESLSYRLQGNYSEEFLMAIMESLIRG